MYPWRDTLLNVLQFVQGVACLPHLRHRCGAKVALSFSQDVSLNFMPMSGYIVFSRAPLESTMLPMVSGMETLPVGKDPSHTSVVDSGFFGY